MPRTLQLYGTASATASGVAQVTIPTASNIRQVSWAVEVDQVADNSRVVLQLSKSPSSQIGTNGALDPFMELRAYGNLVTSGMIFGALNGSQPVQVQCRQGEIVYLHCFIVTTTFYANFILWF